MKPYKSLSKSTILIMTMVLLSACTTQQLTDTQPTVFEDDRISVAVPDSWTAAPQIMMATGMQGTIEIPIGETLTKNQYKLYLLTHHGQASGVEGGRFGEVAMYVAPWVDRTDPWACSSFMEENATPVTKQLSRVDLYFDSTKATPDALAQCGNPTVQGTLWYGSFFTETCPENPPLGSECGGYFLNYNKLSSKKSAETTSEMQMTYTISYDTMDANILPQKGDTVLEELLQEASAVVESISYK